MTCSESQQKLQEIKSLYNDFSIVLQNEIDNTKDKRIKSISYEKRRELQKTKKQILMLINEIKESHLEIIYYFYYYYYPREIQAQTKENYKILKMLMGHNRCVYTLQVLGDGTIVSGGHDNAIIIWKKDKSGNYVETETLWGHSNSKRLQVLHDGTIVSGNEGYAIIIWKKDKSGNYIKTQTLWDANHSSDLQVLRDETIVSGNADSTIKIWKKDESGNYIPTQTLKGYSVNTLQVLPDGTIVSGSDDHIIRILG